MKFLPWGRSSPRFLGPSNKGEVLVRGGVQSPEGFQLRIELREILPPVWRRFLVPGAHEMGFSVVRFFR